MSSLKSGLLDVLTRNGLDADLISKAAQIIDNYVPMDASPSEQCTLPSRYEDVGLLNRDAKVESRYVRDRQLRRVVLMKIDVRPKPTDASRQQFTDQVKEIAQLEHPNIVPVHDVGQLEDGRTFYTLRISNGLTLSAAIQHVHQASSQGTWETAQNGWSFRRLIDSYRQVVLAVSYASTRSVHHKHLTANNVVLGQYGEVLVRDWMNLDTSNAPPDVENLGWLLCHLLTGQHPTPATRSLTSVNHLLRNNSPSIPLILLDVCRRSCAGEIRDPDVLLKGLDSWLEGVQRKEKSEDLVNEANKLDTLRKQLLVHANQVKVESETSLLQASFHAPEEEKYDGWRKQDESQKTLEMAEMLEQEQVKHLNGAISYHAENQSAHLALTQVYWDRVQRRKHDRNTTEHIRDESRLLQSAQRLHRTHPKRQTVEAFLNGPATLTLHTSIRGAKVYRQRYEDDGVVLQPGPESFLGLTPLDNVTLKPGSYLLKIRTEGHHEVTYPVCLNKGEHWDGCAPGEATPTPIWLPPLGAIPDGFCYVPAGWTILGGDPNPDSRGSIRQRVWVDGFAMAKYHVTNAEYLAFLNDLVRRGKADEANRYAPNDMYKMLKDQSNFYCSSDNIFHLDNPETGSQMHPDFSVGNVDVECMVAYMKWMHEKTGHPFRFVRYDEFEKAARGVDERIFPWGNHCDPSIVNMNRSFQSEQKMAAPTEFPLDISPYGIRFLSGNCADVVDGVFDRKPPIHNGRFVHNPLDVTDPNAIHLLRGNGFFGNQSYCRVTNRYYYPNFTRMSPKGFRLCLSLP